MSEKSHPGMGNIMQIEPYCEAEHSQVGRLWNTAGVQQGYAPLTEPELDRLLLCHACFQQEHAFVLKKEGRLAGFVCGCEAKELPRGEERGYFTCLLLEESCYPQEEVRLLMRRLEESFLKKGKRYVVSNFFNPMRLPWVIPGTDGCQHNNAPGIAVESPLYEYLKEMGYTDHAHECAMYLDLEKFVLPQRIREKEERAAAEGYQVEWYDSARHEKLRSMVDSMGNSMWSTEIPEAAEKINMLVAVKNSCVVGFTGPVYPEHTGRGYFAGIAVAKEHEKHGLGTLLFYRLCQEERKAGANYMSLFTGEDNHAQNIYKGAGFEVRKVFAVMSKELKADE